MQRIVAFIVTLALASFALAGAAFAHAEFQSSTPSPSSTVAAAPAAVIITYTEDLAAGSTGSVANGRGVVVGTDFTISTTQRNQLAISLQPNLPAGVYNVSWHSISADDGDQLDGTFFFNVANAAAPAPKAPVAAGPAVKAPSTSTASGTDDSGPALALLALATAIALVSIRALRKRTA